MKLILNNLSQYRRYIFNAQSRKRIVNILIYRSGRAAALPDFVNLSVFGKRQKEKYS